LTWLAGVDYHFRHDTGEFLIVLRGTATLRTPEAEREFPRPPQGRVGSKPGVAPPVPETGSLGGP
jgi:hypothetical protein